MQKFKTAETLIYEYLIRELLEEINDAENLCDFILNQKDMEEELKAQRLYLMKLTHKKAFLDKLHKDSKRGSTSNPVKIEISYIDRFGFSQNKATLMDVELNDESYFYEKSNLTLNMWRDMEEEKTYIFHNLKLKREGEKLISQYPQEKMWYEMSYEDEASRSIFDRYGTEWLYFYSDEKGELL